jgi:hypothetical protein
MREAVSTIHHMRYPHASGDDPNDTEQLSLKSTADMLLEMHSMDVITSVRNIPYLHRCCTSFKQSFIQISKLKPVVPLSATFCTSDEHRNQHPILLGTNAWILQNISIHQSHHACPTTLLPDLKQGI